MSADPIKVMIVDDEPLARRGLGIRMAGQPGFKVVATAGNGREALKAIEEYQPDLMFLDIQMPGMTGFELLQALPEDLNLAVIFVTAFDQHAVAAFETEAVDYLLKPVEDERLAAALDKVRSRQQEKRALDQKQQLLQVASRIAGEPLNSVEDLDAAARNLGSRARLAIRDGQTTVWVYQDEISWVDAAGDYMCVHANGETHIMRTTMKALEDELEYEALHRVHRSTIVNIKHVESMRAHINGEYFLTLRGGHEVKLSRSYKDKLQYLQ